MQTDEELTPVIAKVQKIAIPPEVLAAQEDLIQRSLPDAALAWRNAVLGARGAAPAPRRLDEQALRRPDFCGGAAIELSDGQAWTFAVPVLADFYPALGRDGKPVLVSGYDLGAEYDELVDAYVVADGPVEELPILSAIAFALLRRNYAIEFGDLRYLLRVKKVDDPDLEANAAMWNAIGDLAFGRAPKPSADGSASSSD